jgi:hypothetical protein
MVCFDSTTCITFGRIPCNLSLDSCPLEFLFGSWYILLVPGCIEYPEQWVSPIILWWSSKSFGTTKYFLNHKTPSTSSWKHFTLPNLNLLRMWPIPMSVLWAMMTSSLIVGIRATLVNVPCGMTWRLGFSRSQHDARGGTTRLLQRCLRLNASTMTFALWVVVNL